MGIIKSKNYCRDFYFFLVCLRSKLMYFHTEFVVRCEKNFYFDLEQTRKSKSHSKNLFARMIPSEITYIVLFNFIKLILKQVDKVTISPCWLGDKVTILPYWLGDKVTLSPNTHG